MNDSRVEKDSLGEVRVPADASWGAQTQRAVENFPILHQPLPANFVHALGLVKLACARVNRGLGRLDPKLADAIERAAREVADGKLDAQFPIDVFQTGSGTSTNMNANEVIASRANEILGGKKGDKKPVHPNDHVNMGQSSNDVIPATMNVATLLAIERDLLPALKHLHAALDAKAKEFDDVIKIGRTHLMDAVPIRLGQEFSGYASQVEHSIERLEAVLPHLRELAIGGTAVGTGLNAHEDFGRFVAQELSQLGNTRFTEARNHFEAQHARDSIVWAHAAMTTTATSLMKIANDIRILASGPQTGLGEITIPALQPGSSIMPGKVNPVIPEAVTQVAAQVTGNGVAVTIAGQWGQLDLHTMMPVMIRNTLESAQILSNASRVFADKCVAGIAANREKCTSYIEYSASMVTALAPKIGYDKAAEIAKRALKEGRTVREVAYEASGLSKQEVDALLDPRKQTMPGGTGSGGG
ncbi:MAG TPA: class II fumarate hydratase [Candidatus Thermoplasmatota archaeon]|jgi:fumarate hydratase class II|nr:class II fumarate hydratase [Candidatus Thermoplasmatota archaeon]